MSSIAHAPKEWLAVWGAWWRLPAAILALLVVGTATLCAFFHLVAYHGNCVVEPSQLWQTRLIGSLCLEPHSLPDPATLKLGSPKLPGARASFAAPLSCILDWKANTLSADIPVQPDVCRLRVALSRSRGGAWGEIRLSAVTDAAFSSAQPLLTCRPVADRSSKRACQLLRSLANEPPAEGGPSSEQATARGQPGDIEICNSDGMTGYIKAEGDGKYAFAQDQKGKCTFNEAEGLAYHIESHTEYNWISISRQDGSQVALASRHLSGTVPSEYLQVDVEPGTDSPESALLLMCVLAMVAFDPR